MIVLAAVSCFGAGVFAQQPQPADTPPQNVQQPPQDKLTLLRNLGLTREQIQQIRRINAERKPMMDAAAQRVRAANRRLDEVIYADNLAEGEFQERLKELQLAQAEVSRIRFSNELAIRRVLTPDQLVKFRELRDRFEAARENMQNRRRERILDRRPVEDIDRRPVDQRVVRPLRNDQYPRRIRPKAESQPVRPQ